MYWGWGISNKTDKGNGENLVQTSIDNDMICSNTHPIPKNGNKNNLATRFSYDGVISRQIDFFAIQNRYGNWIINTTSKNFANPNQAMQHKMAKNDIRMEITKPSIDTAENATFDISNFRKSPKRFFIEVS